MKKLLAIIGLAIILCSCTGVNEAYLNNERNTNVLVIDWAVKGVEATPNLSPEDANRVYRLFYAVMRRPLIGLGNPTLTSVEEALLNSLKEKLAIEEALLEMRAKNDG